MNFRPIGSYIVVRPELEETATWLHEHHRRAGSAEVLQVGHLVTVVTAGDRVWFNRYAGTELKLGVDQYLLLLEDELLALKPRGSFLLDKSES